jgi:hypothetical protein
MDIGLPVVACCCVATPAYERVADSTEVGRAIDPENLQADRVAIRHQVDANGDRHRSHWRRQGAGCEQHHDRQRDTHDLAAEWRQRDASKTWRALTRQPSQFHRGVSVSVDIQATSAGFNAGIRGLHVGSAGGNLSLRWAYRRESSPFAGSVEAFLPALDVQ